VFATRFRDQLWTSQEKHGGSGLTLTEDDVAPGDASHFSGQAGNYDDGSRARVGRFVPDDVPAFAFVVSVFRGLRSV
jgi:hypothetical protein